MTFISKILIKLAQFLIVMLNWIKKIGKIATLLTSNKMIPDFKL